LGFRVNFGIIGLIATSLSYDIFLAKIDFADKILGSMKMLCRNKTLSMAVFVFLIAGPILRPTEITVERIEADWLRQEQVRHNKAAPAGCGVTPEQDAIGACDGVKDGKWYDTARIVSRGLKLAENLAHGTFLLRQSGG